MSEAGITSENFSLKDIRVLSDYQALTLPVAENLPAGQVLTYDSTYSIYRAIDLEAETAEVAAGVLFHATGATPEHAAVIIAGTLRAADLTGYEAGMLPLIKVI